MIKTFQLGKVFKSNSEKILAVNSLSCDIPKGSIVGLLGPNGAGKTTTVRMLATILRPTTGGAIVAGYDILQDPLLVRKKIGISSETPSLYGRLTAKRNLRFYADLYGVPRDRRDERIVELLNEFDLSDAIDRKVETYSKGMKQKLSVAKALLHDPEVLMLDEPWAGLSPTATRELRGMIENLSKEHRRTILISTHNLAQAERLADDLIIISHGKLIASGTPAELRRKYMIQPHVQVRVETKFDVEDVVSTLEFVTGVEESSENITEFSIRSFADTPDLVHHLVQQGVRIHDVRELIPSLEDVYIDLVKESSN
ncbi:MAG: ATP-binding cassette domain-containing protein [Candidatus Hodarchaeales archaeon]|jgi:ABC-2 type transport system ATP-binding protein